MTKKVKKVAIMMLIFTISMTTLLFSGCTEKPSFELEKRDTDELIVLSYNIRRKKAFTDKQDKWNYRKEALVEHIFKYSPDIIGMQEVWYSQLKYLDKNLPGYAYVGRGREVKEKAGEGIYIFYREDRLELIDSEIFWLSETPDKAGKGWDATNNRIAVMALFQDKRTKEMFYHYNTHLDNTGEKAKEKGMELILGKIEKLEYPVIFTADFNIEEDNPNYAIATTLLDDVKYKADKTMSGQTFHNYGASKIEGPIDFCLVTPQDFDIKEYRILNEKINGRYTSDHYPIYARLLMKK